MSASTCQCPAGTVQAFGRQIVFANTSGVYSLFGGTAEKVSDALDGVFETADFSHITPTAAVLTTLAVILTAAGTASLISIAIAFFIAINVALCMGELGSMYPLAGGLYSIVTRVFGKPIGFLALVDYVGQGVFIPATVIVGFGTYVNVLFPSVPVSLAAGLGMVAVTLLAMMAIRFNAWLTAVFLVLELLVVGTLAVTGFIHWNQPLSNVTNWMVADPNGHLSAVGLGALIAGITIALYAVNGYDSAINFSEETKGGGRQVGRAVVTALLLAIVFQFVPFVGIYFGAPSLGKLTGAVTWPKGFVVVLEPKGVSPMPVGVNTSPVWS